MTDSVSIVIVTINGLRFVQECIQSILSSKTPDCEIVVVDNGSADDTPCQLRRQFGERIQVVEIGSNIGPAAARNRGVAQCRGDIIGFLDNDTLVHPAWAEAAVAVFSDDKTIGIVQSKLLLASDHHVIDYVGEYLGQNGFLVQNAPFGARDEGQYDQRVEILAAKSAGMFIRKSVFDEIGGFDADYFIYVEETDLGWRTWLHGYRAVLAPDSIVYHHFGGSAVTIGRAAVNFNAKFHGCKNYILTLSKNLGGRNLILILPVHVLAWIGLAGYCLLRGQGRACFWILRGIGWNIRNWRASRRKRQQIQARRQWSDFELAPRIMRHRPWLYYINKAITVRVLGHAEGFVRRVKPTNAKTNPSGGAGRTQDSGSHE
ncbi:MAG: glycosyltransferase family 2 protein [Kiritimatiellia bacterium]